MIRTAAGLVVGFVLFAGSACAVQERIPAAVQASRDSDAVRIIAHELEVEKDPANRAALSRELVRVRESSVVAQASPAASAVASRSPTVLKKSAAPKRVEPSPGAAEFSMEYQAIHASHLVQLVYAEYWPDRAVVLDPSVLQDDRVLTLRYAAKDGPFRPFFVSFLAAFGYVIEVRNSADFIKPTPPAAETAQATDPDLEVFLYRPLYREPSYLIEAISPLFKGKFTTQRSVKAAPNSGFAVPTVGGDQGATAVVQKNLDYMIFAGSKQEVVVMKRLLAQLDTEVIRLYVKAVVYEVQTSSSDASAVSIVGSLLGSKLQLSLGTGQLADNFLSLKVGDLSAIVSILDSDSRFKIMSAPEVLVNSGFVSHLGSVDKVPTLSTVSYPGGTSAPVQSVTYQSTGVVLDVRPTAHQNSIDLHIEQQVSSFANTTSGVNNSPTIPSREVTTDVTTRDGEVIMLGGMRQERKSNAGYHLPWFSRIHSDGSSTSTTDLVMFLQVKKL